MMTKLKVINKSIVKDLKESVGTTSVDIKDREEVKPFINIEDLIPTGSTLLNCALSGNPFGGYGKGKVVNIIGDSFSGKTLLALTCFAEVCQQKRFDDYSLILGDVENALEFDIGTLFGGKTKGRVIIDQVPDKIQEWYQDIWLLLKKGKANTKVRKEELEEERDES